MERKNTESERIIGKVLGPDSSACMFNMRKNCPLGKLIKKYVKRKGLNKLGIAICFRFNGNPVHEMDTPVSLHMEEGDVIDVYEQQTGGTGRKKDQSRSRSFSKGCSKSNSRSPIKDNMSDKND